MVTKCTTNFALITVHFTHTPYLWVALLLTVSRTQFIVLLLTVQTVLCEERPASTSGIKFRRIFTEQCLNMLVARLSLRRPEYHHTSYHIRYMVYKIVLEQILIPGVRRVSLSASFHPMLHAHLYLYVDEH